MWFYVVIDFMIVCGQYINVTTSVEKVHKKKLLNFILWLNNLQKKNIFQQNFNKFWNKNVQWIVLIVLVNALKNKIYVKIKFSINIKIIDKIIGSNLSKNEFKETPVVKNT